MKTFPILLGSSALVLLGALTYLQPGADDSPRPAGPEPSATTGPDAGNTAVGGAADASPALRQRDESDPAASTSPQPASFDAKTIQDYAQLQTYRPDTQLTLEEYAAASNRTGAWEPRSDAPTGLELSEEEKLDGRSFIQLDRNKIASLVPGDTLEVEIPETGARHTLQIEDIHLHNDGTESLTGSLQGMPPEYSATITQGEKNTLMGITTASGHHTLEARGEDGWVIATGSNVEHAPEGVYSQFVVPPRTPEAGAQ